ncbi:MAG: SIS domain-containing protein [Clostridia bacterium]|nr:SIS domain-containing protein [Clostridia bacterium]
MEYRETKTWKEINETPSVISKIFEINADTMSKLVKEIKESKITNFVTAGRGSSNHAIVYFKYLMEIMSNYTVGLSAPSIVTLYRGKTNYANSIILGVSSSGKAEDVIEVVKKGNEEGAITISVTNNADSPLAKLAKYHLYCGAGEEESYVATKTFTAETFILAWLGCALSNNKNDIDILKSFKLDLDHILPEIDEITTLYANKFVDMKDCFVLSRGLCYPVALEASLLLQETCYIQAKGYANSEFYHGPLAMVNKDTPVIIFCAEYDGDEEIQSIIRADQIRFIEKMLSFHAPILLVTNDIFIKGTFKKCYDAFLNFSVPEEFSVFAFTLFAQMFACKISCLKGNNPDNSDKYEKEIITK